MVHRLGVIHIPGSAGASLGDALGRSLGCRYLAIHHVTDEDTDLPVETFSLRVPSQTDSLTKEIMLSYPLFSGHLSVGQIQATNRTHIILVVSEPRSRLVRLYAHLAIPNVSFNELVGNPHRLSERDRQSVVIRCADSKGHTLGRKEVGRGQEAEYSMEI